MISFDSFWPSSDTSSSLKMRQNVGNDAVKICLYFTLPHTDHRPTEQPQLHCRVTVSAHIRLDLSKPILCVRPSGQFWPTNLPIAAVPEVSVAEHDNSLPAKNNVRLSWQPSRMQPIAQTKIPKGRAQPSFWLGVTPWHPSLNVRASGGTRDKTSKSRRALHSSKCRMEQRLGVACA
jgi:hypothetical protein